MIMSKLLTGRLENWVIDDYNCIIWGDIYDDIALRWCDAQPIHTSFIKGLKDMNLKEGDIVTTLNSTYLLGKPMEVKHDDD